MDALTGDEDAQLDFIRFIVTETDIPLPDVAVGWLTALAEKGNDHARRCYFSWALAGGAESPDWLKLEQWAVACIWHVCISGRMERLRLTIGRFALCWSWRSRLIPVGRCMRC